MEKIIFTRPYDEDQQDTCPYCGARTDCVAEFRGKEIHVCLNDDCEIVFYIQQETKEEFAVRKIALRLQYSGK